MDGEPIPSYDRCNPDHYTKEELRAALECADNLFGDYLRGALRGEMSWDDLDATHGAAAVELRRLEAAGQRHWAGDYFPEGEWVAEARAGDTKLGYEEWLMHQIESAQP